jgi:hypothetical protein
MLEKMAIYEEMAETFPHSADIFNEKIAKGEQTIKLFPQIMKEYF